MRIMLYKLAIWWIGKCNTKWEKSIRGRLGDLDRLTYKNSGKYFLFRGADAEWQKFSRYDVLDNAIQKLGKYEDNDSDKEEEAEMADMMEFPETLEKFIKEYSFKDTQEVYTNGSQLIQVYRLQQGLEHYQRDHDIKKVIELVNLTTMWNRESTKKVPYEFIEWAASQLNGSIKSPDLWQRVAKFFQEWDGQDMTATMPLSVYDLNLINCQRLQVMMLEKERAEQRNSVIDEFAESLETYKYGRTNGIYIEIPLHKLEEIAEEMKGDK